MPANRSTSKIAAKYGERAQQAFLDAKDKEVELSGFSSLPGGITGGVAELRVCEFGEFKTGDNQGEMFFMAQGVVLAPETHTYKDAKTGQTVTVGVAGKRTRIGPEALCDTPGKTRATTEEHVAWIINELKKLGGDFSGSDDVEELETVAAALAEMKPTFNFSTRTGRATAEYPNPRVFEEWEGIAAYEMPADAGAGTEDKTAAPPPPKASKNGPAPTKAAAPASAKPNPAQARATAPPPPKTNITASKPAPTQPQKGPTKTAPKKPVPPPEPPEPEESEQLTTFQLMELAEQADNGDQDAKDKLTLLAQAAGHDDEEIDTADNWVLVAEMIPASDAGEEPAEEEGGDTEEPTFKVGDVYAYQKVDKQGKPLKDAKGKALKPIEVEITVVNAAQQTVKAKSVDDGKTLFTIPFDKLLQA
jgi:hypothetical protein